jgi:hypothetical protein
VLLKNIGFILAIYILALNFAPCEDSNETMDVASASVEAVDLDNNHEHSDLDPCSPFCQCNCCQIFVTYHNLADLEIISNEISTEIYLHLDSLGKDITDPLLHPPRL